MSVENIIKKINADVDRKIKSIKQRQKELEKKIREEFEAEKNDRMEEIRKREAREIKVMTNRIISQAKLDKRKKVLKVREEEIDKVFNEALKKVRELGPDQQKDHIRQAIGKASALLEGRVSIHCTPESEDMVKELAEKIDPKLGIEADLSGVSGILGVSEDGTSLDLTIEANLQRMKKELRKEIARRLFTEEN